MRNFLRSRSGLVMLGFLAVGGYFLWAEHRAHMVAVLPWLLIGGCLVMHLFMHGGHGGRGGHEGDSEDSARTPKSDGDAA